MPVLCEQPNVDDCGRDCRAPAVLMYWIESPKWPSAQPVYANVVGQDLTRQSEDEEVLPVTTK